MLLIVLDKPDNQGKQQAFPTDPVTTATYPVRYIPSGIVYSYWQQGNTYKGYSKNCSADL